MSYDISQYEFQYLQKTAGFLGNKNKENQAIKSCLDKNYNYNKYKN